MGLYIHIPFCKQACHYCNFHFSTSIRYQEEMIAAIVQEIAIQKDFLTINKLSSIYFGGGTPSILSEKYLGRIMDEIYKWFDVDPAAEITLEANPDDLSLEKLQFFKSLKINRLSIGVQSFIGEELTWMNRAHTQEEAMGALARAFETGFDDVNLDLIYGLPFSTDEAWSFNMDKAFSFPINHISAYALTVEPKTALAHFIRKGTSPPVDDAIATHQYEMLMEKAQVEGWDHYEISNFSLPGKEAKHNTAYWQGKPYLGVGPSAHSFNGTSRQWNVANNQTYMRQITQNIIPAEVEVLDTKTQYNEYVMTGLRTKWGCTLDKIADFGTEYVLFFRKEVVGRIQSGHIIDQDGAFVLTQKGRHFADQIASDLMWVEGDSLE